MKKPQPIKIKDIREVMSSDGKTYIYALGRNGLIYFMVHDITDNQVVWHKLPTPDKVFRVTVTKVEPMV